VGLAGVDDAPSLVDQFVHACLFNSLRLRDRSLFLRRWQASHLSSLTLRSVQPQALQGLPEYFSARWSAGVIPAP